MPYRCDRCGRAWDDESAKLNAFRCYSGCGGGLKQTAGTGVDHMQPPGERFAWLPSVLAIPYREYAAEKHAVMRLFRLCETVENLTRFLAILAFGCGRLGSMTSARFLVRDSPDSAGSAQCPMCPLCQPSGISVVAGCPKKSRSRP
jgi:hypothetical protein